MSKKGIFITFEGTDGVGKSTQINLTHTWFVVQGFHVVVTREPGGGALSEKIRRLLLDPSLSMDGLTELFLYEAARVEHVKSVIRPALDHGKIVLCDRFTDATIAYQGYARGLKKEAAALNLVAAGGLRPDLTILLNLPPEKALERARKLKGNADRLENEGVEFQKKVQRGYLDLARKEPARVKLISVQPTPEATQSLIQAAIKRKLHGYFGTTPRAPLSYGRA